MKRWIKLLLLALALGAAAAAVHAAGEDLAKGFQNPPDSAKPHTWWHWMNGNITKEGITLDLEAMKRVGVGGAQIFTADCGIPAGPVKFMSPEWREMIKHAAAEANRLGIELCIHNCAGWSSSGGPWVTPEHAMQKVVTSEKRVSGPRRLTIPLAQPPTNLDFYRDIAVLAFPAPRNETVSMADFAPTFSASSGKIDGAKLMDRLPNTTIRLPLPTRAKPQYLQVEFKQPFAARVVRIVPGGGMAEVGGTLQVSTDGKKFRNLRTFSFPRAGAGTLNLNLDQVVAERFWRLTFNRATARSRQIAVAEFEISPRQMIENIDVKDGLTSGNVGAPKWGPPVPELAVARDGIVDLTKKMSRDGKLTWDVPAGDWVILRLGYTPTGKNNHPAPPEGTGPECDKLSRAGLDNHWAGMMKTVLSTLGPLAGKSLNNALIDSYEVGGQNWTKDFRAEFQKRRGYDPIPYLPTFTGRIVESPELTERFLWDLRRTISDLFAENYYGYFAELCHKAGLKASIEPYTGPFESMQVGAPADIPMGEFWSGSSASSINGSVRLAASVGHIYGRSVIGAESFTAAPENGKWQNDPQSFKALGDMVYCLGVNRYIFHRYAHQPWTKSLPGMTMGQWGFHFERTNTWFEQAAAWLKYCARCQYLLQSGVFAADVAYFLGEDAPAEFVSRKSLQPALPEGYDFDGMGKDVLMKHMSVKDGRIVLDTGMSYRVLVLPPSAMFTPEVLRKIKALVEAGATVIGPCPVGSPSLQDYSRCETEVQRLAAEMWGPKGKAAATVERSVGKGKVIAGKSLEEVFAAMGVKPDFECTTPDSKVIYIHRIIGDAEVYFVSNQRPLVQDVQCTFRVAGRLPELWNPETGAIAPAPAYAEQGGRVTVPLHFDPAGSTFVVFRQAAPAGDHAVSIAYAPAAPGQGKPAAPKIVIKKAFYEAVDGFASVDVTAKVQDLVASGKMSIPATTAVLSGKDPAYLHVKQLRIEYELDGKPLTKITPENQELELPEMGEAAMPAYEVAAADGKLTLTAWQPGTATIKTASGKEVKSDPAGIFADLIIPGPWDVSFPPNWGAPAKVTLEKLTSWTDHPDQGVKYFSGTATYTKKLAIPESLLAPGKPLSLDLGRVKNLAEVILNGKSLGVLWKSPFRVELTGLVKPGDNTLEIKVTNMWCNRLIGDEQLPDDREWNGKQLKEWPQWFLEGKPRPSQGRFTFTTWHHFDKDSPLFESGLLGPVTLRGAEKVTVELPR